MSLFDQAPTYTVAELWDELRGTLERTFPDDLWVEGEIRNIHRSGRGHVYFDLVDPTTVGRQPDAMISVILFNDMRELVNRQLVRTGATRMTDGVKVRIRCVPDAYPPQGRLQLRMTGIDLNYTLGLLAADRERLLKTLAAEDLLDANKRTVLADPPLRIGLVTSYDSAAYNDFVHELQRSACGFVVVCADSPVQGDGAELAIAASVVALGQRDVDVIALVRGGGARTDLASFDSEPVARAIAASPVPVLTGVGHEVDRAVADEVAFEAYKTPTACAASLVQRVDAFVGRLDGAWADIAATATMRLADADKAVVEAAGMVVSSARTALGDADRRAVDAAYQVSSEAQVRIERARARLERARGQARASAQRPVLAGRLRLDAATERLRRQTAHATTAANRDLDALAGRLRLLDPAHTLARGWSITRTHEGRLVRGPDDAPAGTRLATTTAGGQISSEVTDP